jgi:hypothetical protein
MGITTAHPLLYENAKYFLPLTISTQIYTYIIKACQTVAENFLFNRSGKGVSMNLVKTFAAIAALCAQPALAAEQLFTLSFTASNPSLSHGSSSYVPPAQINGSFRFLYDPNNTAPYATPRAVQQVNLSIGGQQYNAATTFFETPTFGGALNTIGFGDVRQIPGLENTIGSVFAGGSTADFRLVLGQWGGPFNQQVNSLVFSVPGEDAVWRASSISYSVSAAAVPEPGSWAMLLAGFALAGAALRKRRFAAA